MNDELFALISEKREQVNKLKYEMNLLLTVYHCLPSDAETKKKQKEYFDEYGKND